MSYESSVSRPAIDNWQAAAITALRVIVGLLFLSHALVKLFGFPAGVLPGPQSLASLKGAAALMEFIGGPLIVFGLFVRPVAFLLSGEMAVAYFMVHAPEGFLPIANRGEAAVLYCFVFLYLAAAGAGPWSLDSRMLANRSV